MTLMLLYLALGITCVLALTRTARKTSRRAQLLERIERALRDLDGRCCMSPGDRDRALGLTRAAVTRMDLTERGLRDLSRAETTDPTPDTRATRHRRRGIERLSAALAEDEQRLTELADLAEALAAEQLLARTGASASAVDEILTELWSRLEILEGT